MDRFFTASVAAVCAALAAALVIVAPVSAEGITPAQLQAQGWACFVPPPFPESLICANPAEGLPPVPPAPEGRAAYSFLLFDRTTGDLVGTVHMLRADLYHGQPCPRTGGDYVFNPVIGYYRCGL